MRLKTTSTKGFTLLEILVVVAIVALMSVTVIVSFGSFGETVRLQKTAEIIQDRIKQLELEIVASDYQKNTLHFETNFLVVESQPHTTALNLSYHGLGTEGCAAQEAALKISGLTSEVHLEKRNEHGQTLEVVIVKKDGIQCIAFMQAHENEWQFQLKTPTSHSQVIRLLHFNLDRQNTAPLLISEGTEYRLEIEAPYAKKQFYQGDQKQGGALSLKLSDQNDEIIIPLN